MSASLTGKPKPWQKGRKHSAQTKAKMRAFWTPQQREAKRQQELAHNPNAIYHGLSARMAKKLREAVGRCELLRIDKAARHPSQRSE